MEKNQVLALQGCEGRTEKTLLLICSLSDYFHRCLFFVFKMTKTDDLYNNAFSFIGAEFESFWNASITHIRGIMLLEKLLREYLSLFSRLVKDLVRITEFYKEEVELDVSNKELREFFNYFADSYIKLFQRLFDFIDLKESTSKLLIDSECITLSKSEIEKSKIAFLEHIKQDNFKDIRAKLSSNLNATLGREDIFARYEDAYVEGKYLYLKSKFSKEFDIVKQFMNSIAETYAKRFYKTFIQIISQRVIDILEKVEHSTVHDQLINKLNLPKPRKNLPDMMFYNKTPVPNMNHEKLNNIIDSIIDGQQKNVEISKKKIEKLSYLHQDNFSDIISKTLKKGIQAIILQSEITSTTNVINKLSNDFKLNKSETCKKLQTLMTIPVNYTFQTYNTTFNQNQINSTMGEHQLYEDPEDRLKDEKLYDEYPNPYEVTGVLKATKNSIAHPIVPNFGSDEAEPIDTYNNPELWKLQRKAKPQRTLQFDESESHGLYEVSKNVANIRDTKQSLKVECSGIDELQIPFSANLSRSFSTIYEDVGIKKIQNNDPKTEL